MRRFKSGRPRSTSGPCACWPGAWGSGPGPKRICDLRLKGTRTSSNTGRWACGRGPGWEEGDLEFFIKAGKDQDNFYMYHTPARTTSWEPEDVERAGVW